MSDRRRIYVLHGGAPEREPAPFPEGVEEVSAAELRSRIDGVSDLGALMIVDDAPALRALLPGLLPSALPPTIEGSGQGAVSILLLEDVASDAALVEAQLHEFDGVQRYELEHHITLASGSEAARERSFDIALVDIRLPDTDGVATVTELRALVPELPIVCLTGNDDEAVALACVEAGAHAYLEKSHISPVQLRRTLTHTLARVRRERLRELEAARRYEHELKRLNGELSRSNRDLESFARVAAHDLSGPLSSVNQLIGWISSDLGDEGPPRASQNVAMLERRVRRMQELVRDALTWAQAGNSFTEAEPVDLGALARELFEECQPPAGVELTRAPTLAVTTTRGALAQALRNLIANAVRHGGEHLEVEAGWVAGPGITAAQAAAPSGFLRFVVRDDGPGIEPSRRHRVFEMGVSSDVERRGSGMGLAIVQRIVTRAGGAISVQAAPSGGAEFRFTWPATGAPR